MQACGWKALVKWELLPAAKVECIDVDVTLR
jgi:hypothetical protein